MALDKRDKNKRWKFSTKIIVCNHCGAENRHHSWQCPSRPRKKLNREAPRTRAKRQSTSAQWYEANPPDENGYWTCYLNISQECPRLVTRTTINLEHVKPKLKFPHLKFDINNLRPACQPCNLLKGPWTLEELAETYPRAREILDQHPEFRIIQTLDKPKR